MPIAKVQMSDGRIARFEVPEGTTPEQVQQFAAQQFAAQEPQAQEQIAQPTQELESPNLIDRFVDIAKAGTGNVEALATIASGAVAEPLAGLAGIGAALIPGGKTGAEAVEETRAALTFDPISEEGKERVGQIGELASAIPDFGKGFGDFVFEKTGSPEFATVAASTPTALAEIIGLGAVFKGVKGARLLDDAGNPTRALSKALDDQGLVFENLSPDVRSQIPAIAPRESTALLPASAAGVADDALKSQIKAGGRDDALAGLAVVGDKVVPDSIGLEAVRQGFDEGFVQAAKTASPDTKKSMRKMLSMMNRITKNRRLGLEFRPSDVTGDALSKRVQFIRDSATSSTRQLNEIARTELSGLSVSPEPVLNKLRDSLDDLDVSLSEGVSGVPVPEFKGSLISKDRTSQKVIKDLISLMSEGGQPDALRMHKMKRQLDNMIDFRKKSVGGLSEAGRNVLKGIRSELNSTIRGVSPAYASVNDDLNKSLTALDDFQSVSGSSIDVFGEGANKAIGQDMRGLMSNRKTRVKLENAVNQIEDVASELGGTFNESVKDLTLFANGIEDVFGATAQTSLKGEVESAIKQTGAQGARAAAQEKIIAKGAEGLEKLRGINQFNAFKAMDDLLKR